MTTAREAVLARLGSPGGDPAAEYAAIRRDYLEQHHPDVDLVELLAERVADYRAVVHVVPEGELPRALARALREGDYVIPEGVPEEWVGGIEPARRAAVWALDEAVASNILYLKGESVLASGVALKLLRATTREVRAWRRARVGKCRGCGYPVEGFTRCPECGRERECPRRGASSEAAS